MSVDVVQVGGVHTVSLTVSWHPACLQYSPACPSYGECQLALYSALDSSPLC